MTRTNRIEFERTEDEFDSVNYSEASDEDGSGSAATMVCWREVKLPLSFVDFGSHEDWQGLVRSGTRRITPQQV